MSESTPEPEVTDSSDEEFTETVNSAWAKEQDLESTPDENPGPPENDNPSEAGETLADEGTDETTEGTQ